MKEPFNPGGRNVPLYVRVWELLRRNPFFREDYRKLRMHARWIEGEENGREVENVQEFFQNLDHACPIAGFVMHWAFRAHPFSGNELEPCVPATWRDLGMGYVHFFLPHVSRSSIDQHLTSGMETFIRICPFYLNRGAAAADQNKAFKFGPFLLPENCATDRLDRDTLLESSWPELPRMFQEHFQWLWGSHYDYSTVNPYTGDRSLLPELHIGGDDQDALITASYWEGVVIPPKDPVALRMNDSVALSLPPLRFGGRDLVKDVENFLSQIYWDAKQHGNADLLGSREIWKTFLAIYPSMLCEFDAKGNMQREGTGAALAKLPHLGKGKMQSHQAKRWDYLFDVMMSLYPDFQPIVEPFEEWKDPNPLLCTMEGRHVGHWNGAAPLRVPE